MPYVNIRITREGTTRAQKAALIKGVTGLLKDVLDKDPATTFVVLDEVELEDWGVGGLLRRCLSPDAGAEGGQIAGAKEQRRRGETDEDQRRFFRSRQRSRGRHRLGALAHAGRRAEDAGPGRRRGGARDVHRALCAGMSRFSPHVHGGGEEFIVLDGVFQDEHGDYPAGSYVRNPPQSRHTPGSAAGCTIFVKLWQFDAADRRCVNRDLLDTERKPVPGREGVTAADIFHSDREEVRVEHWQADMPVKLPPNGGLEIFCLDGRFVENGETFRRHSWLRLPQNAALDARAGAGGCLVWVKEGHLRFVDADLAAIAST